MNKITLLILCIPVALAGGCTTIGPTAAVMPGPHKTLVAFDADRAACTQYSDQTLAGAADTYNKSQIATVAAGAVLGAGLGGAIGGGRGAGIGAAGGAVAGTAADGIAGNRQLDSLQRRYDIAYSQCMYLKGNNVPIIQ